jgi:hypothetical protein
LFHQIFACSAAVIFATAAASAAFQLAQQAILAQLLPPLSYASSRAAASFATASCFTFSRVVAVSLRSCSTSAFALASAGLF